MPLLLRLFVINQDYFINHERTFTVGDIIAIMKKEAEVAISKVAFRKLNPHGGYVSVKYQDNSTFCVSDSYTWSFGDQKIGEAQARILLAPLVEQQRKAALRKEPMVFHFNNGWTMKRELGVVRLAINNGLGVDALNKWVLRNADNEAVDMDKYLNDILERHELTIGDPISEGTTNGVYCEA